MSALAPLQFEPAKPVTGAMFIGFAPAAPWHQRRPELLHRALGTVHRDTPEAGEVADAFLPRMPSYPVACHNLRTAGFGEPFSSPRHLYLATPAPWTAVDDAVSRNALLFDIDHTNGPELVAALQPHVRPHLMVDPYSGRSHAVIFLASPVWVGKGASLKAQRYANFVQKLIAAELQATSLPRGMLIKNPMGRVDALDGVQVRRTQRPATPELWDRWVKSGSELLWITILGAPTVSLHDIVAALKDKHGDNVRAERFCHRAPNLQGASIPGRNNALFAQVGAFARTNHIFELEPILAEGSRFNGTLRAPLPASEVRSTAKSVWRWMLNHFAGDRRYTGRRRADGQRGPGGNRGRDRVACTGLAVDQRMALAGRVTGAARRSKTDTKIATAIERLGAAGQRITQVVVAAEAGVGIATVKRRWSMLCANSRGSNAAPSG
jgi:hypothetical protein